MIAHTSQRLDYSNPDRRALLVHGLNEWARAIAFLDDPRSCAPAPYRLVTRLLEGAGV